MLMCIDDLPIRRDAGGRWSLNDLHLAAGGHDRHRPSKWLRYDKAKELIREMESQALNRASNLPPIRTIKGRGITATYAVKELCYAYAMWVSAKFHLAVIAAYDELVTGDLLQPQVQAQKYWFGRRPHWREVRRHALAGSRHVDTARLLGRSPSSVSRACRRMVEVGLLHPEQWFKARWREPTARHLLAVKQLALDFGVAPPEGLN